VETSHCEPDWAYHDESSRGNIGPGKKTLGRSRFTAGFIDRPHCAFSDDAEDPVTGNRGGCRRAEHGAIGTSSSPIVDLKARSRMQPGHGPVRPPFCGSGTPQCSQRIDSFMLNPY
jgi:hypothetical protein